MIEKRASFLSSQRAQRSFSLWENYEMELRRRRLDGNSEELDAEKRAVEDDSGGEGEEDDGISINNAEMLFYLQSDDDDEDNEDEDGDEREVRARREEREERQGSSNFNSNSISAPQSSKINRGGPDPGPSPNETRGKYSFSFGEEDGDSVLKEGEYVDDREQEQVIQSEARRASGKYRWGTYRMMG
jgi:hypothetical protein